jgi:LysR family transcriptional regulator, transcriptional activator for bauABCD operon
MSNISQIYDVDLKHLRCFCTIVEERSFTAAQATLNMSQSMMSEYLRSLEIRLGTRLCQRGPKGFKLFREGKIVYEAAKDLFAAVETFRQRASEIDESTHYELVIAIQDGIVEHPEARIGEAMQRFTEYYPNVHFRVEILLGYQLIGRIADGLTHVGVGLSSKQFPQLQFEHLFDEHMHLCCGRGHPFFELEESQITSEEIESATYCNRGHLEGFHPERVARPGARGDVGQGAHAHLALIMSGRNVGYVPDHIAEPYIQAGSLRRLRPDLTHVVNGIHAVTGPGSAEFKLANRFVDALVDLHMEPRPNKVTHLPKPGSAARAGFEGAWPAALQTLRK